jgi:hypothetical protein
MVKKIMRSADGYYHVQGQKYQMLIGSRAQVMHGTAYKTEGKLTKGALLYNKHDHIVSRKKHISAKHDRRLERAGYFTKKGTFGFVKRAPAKSKTVRRRTRRGRVTGGVSSSSGMGMSRA